MQFVFSEVAVADPAPDAGASLSVPLKVMWDITVALPRRRSFSDVRQVCGCFSRVIWFFAETLRVM